MRKTTRDLEMKMTYGRRMVLAPPHHAVVMEIILQDPPYHQRERQRRISTFLTRWSGWWVREK